MDSDGVIQGEPIRLRTGLASPKSVRAAVDAVKSDPKLRADLILKASSARDEMIAHNWGYKESRAQEMQDLIDAVKALG